MEEMRRDEGREPVYVRLGADGYVARMGTTGGAEDMLLDVPEDFDAGWMHCYRVAGGVFVLDEAKRAALLEAAQGGGGEGIGALDERVSVLEETVEEIVSAQAAALEMLGVMA